MLNDLSNEAGELAGHGLEVMVTVFYRDVLISGGRSHTSQRQAAFFGFVRTVFGGDDWIDHDEIHETGVDHDNAFRNANHIGSHSYAVFPVGSQGVQQVTDGMTILRTV